jgi:hypothetical protein
MFLWNRLGRDTRLLLKGTLRKKKNNPIKFQLLPTILEITKQFRLHLPFLRRTKKSNIQRGDNQHSKNRSYTNVKCLPDGQMDRRTWVRFPPGHIAQWVFLITFVSTYVHALSYYLKHLPNCQNRFRFNHYV